MDTRDPRLPFMVHGATYRAEQEAERQKPRTSADRLCNWLCDHPKTACICIVTLVLVAGNADRVLLS